jgi:hypothetical protein
MSFLGELLDRAGANRASVKEAQFPIDPKNNCTADKEQQQQGNEPPIGMLNLKLFAGERENSPHSSRGGAALGAAPRILVWGFQRHRVSCITFWSRHLTFAAAALFEKVTSH